MKLINPPALIDFIYRQKNGYYYPAKYILYFEQEVFEFCDFSEVIAKYKNSKKTFYILNFAEFYGFNKQLFKIEDDTSSYFYSEHHPLYFESSGIYYKDAKAVSVNSYSDFMKLIEYLRREEVTSYPNSFAAETRYKLKAMWEASHKRYGNKSLNIEGEVKNKEIFRKTFYGGNSCYRYIEPYHGRCFEFDVDSAYIYELLYKKFPTKQFCKVPTNIRDIWKKNPYIIKAKCKLIEAKSYFHPIQVGWLTEGKKIISNNKHELLCAADAELYITNLDLIEAKKWYKFKDLEEECYYICDSWDYLPDKIRRYIFSLYHDKDADKFYKVRLQTCFGNFCLGINNKSVLKVENEHINKNDRNSILPFTVGYFVTAYSRYRFNKAVDHFKDYFIYGSVDSLLLRTDTPTDMLKYIIDENKEVKNIVNQDISIGQWKSDGAHDFHIYAEKAYLRDGIAKIAGYTMPKKPIEKDCIIFNTQKRVAYKNHPIVKFTNSYFSMKEGIKNDRP